MHDKRTFRAIAISVIVNKYYLILRQLYFFVVYLTHTVSVLGNFMSTVSALTANIKNKELICGKAMLQPCLVFLEDKHYLFVVVLLKT